MEPLPRTEAACNNTHKDYLLAELKCTALRIRLILADVETVGLSIHIYPEDILARVDAIDRSLVKRCGRVYFHLAIENGDFGKHR